MTFTQPEWNVDDNFDESDNKYKCYIKVTSKSLYIVCCTKNVNYVNNNETQKILLNQDVCV